MKIIQKNTANMELSELIDYWSGRLCVAIGAGKFRDEVNLMLQATMRDAYERGKNKMSEDVQSAVSMDM